jgi:transcriptional regulator with XRE-family HTH domain
MDKDRAQTLTKNYQQRFRDLRQAARRLADTDESDGRFDDLVGELLQAIMKAANAAIEVNSEIPRELDYQKIIANRLHESRQRVGWTQAQVAQGMQQLGYKWTRDTVAGIENDVRKVSLEELLGFAVLFNVPMVQFIKPPLHHKYIFPNNQVISGDLLWDLVSGEETREARTTGVLWLTAETIAGFGSDRWRPAEQLRLNEPKGFSDSPEKGEDE